LAVNAENEGGFYDWEEHQKQLQTAGIREVPDRPDVSSSWKTRPTTSEIINKCPISKYSEDVEVEIFGNSYCGISLNAAKVLVSVLYRTAPINFPNFMNSSSLV